MSVNFGYGGYGMNGGMNNYGNNIQGGNYLQSIESQYGCPTCYQYGTIPYNLRTSVNPLPQPSALNQSWLGRAIRHFFDI